MKLHFRGIRNLLTASSGSPCGMWFTIFSNPTLCWLLLLHILQICLQLLCLYFLGILFSSSMPNFKCCVPTSLPNHPLTPHLCLAFSSSPLTSVTRITCWPFWDGTPRVFENVNSRRWEKLTFEKSKNNLFYSAEALFYLQRQTVLLSYEKIF